jgi:hypothetical protein
MYPHVPGPSTYHPDMFHNYLNLVCTAGPIHSQKDFWNKRELTLFFFVYASA